MIFGTLEQCQTSSSCGKLDVPNGLVSEVGMNVSAAVLSTVNGLTLSTRVGASRMVYCDVGYVGTATTTVRACPPTLVS